MTSQFWGVTNKKCRHWNVGYHFIAFQLEVWYDMIIYITVAKV